MADPTPVTYSLHSSLQLTDSQIQECTHLFSSHYGLWGKCGYGKEGTRVKFTPSRFKSTLLFDEDCFAVRAVSSSSNDLIGHVIMRTFSYEPLGGSGLWVTQLVVHQDYRSKGIAQLLILNALKGIKTTEGIVAAGIASSHPHAIRAFQRATGTNDVKANFPFIAKHGRSLIEASGVTYLQSPNNEVTGTIFDSTPATATESGKVSLVRSNFFVAHEEPQVALEGLKEKWELGELEEGAEFLFVAPVKGSKKRS